jgi:UDP-glucose 4-epimerase
MVIPRFVQQALKNNPLTVYGDGTQLRSFIHIEDTVQGLISLMESDGTNGEIFNLGSPEPVSIKQLAERIIRLSASKSQIEYISYEQEFGKHFEDLKYRVPDISKISRVVGFKPKKTLEDIIKDVIEYYKKS